MRADQVFPSAQDLAAKLRKIKARRKREVKRRRSNRPPRATLTVRNRSEVLLKTGKLCHICGGAIDGDDWHADHILAYAAGGARSIANYLPAHSLCNSYRRHFDPVEFQLILKFGVWLRTEIANETVIGRMAGQAFCQKERRRDGRRQNHFT